MAFSATTHTRLEKAAVDNGFDRELPTQGDWLGYKSTQTPLRVWLTAIGDDLYLVAVSQANVGKTLADHGTSFTNPLPKGACAARGVTSIPALHDLVRRAFRLSRALPDEPLRAFEKKTRSLPRTTEAERLVVQRVGQDVFRGGLLDYWEGRCAVTGLAIPELLRASHAKPWAACETDAERLDVFNGLLLAPHLDAAFDAGFMTVGEDGDIVVSPTLPPDARGLLGLDQPLHLRRLDEGHAPYLAWHRAEVFRAETA